MKIIIAGAGAVGTHLAKLLSREKQDIILMDDNEERMSTLSSNFDLMTVTASPTSIKGLKEVGVGEADLFIAVTPDESRNITACMLATNLGAVKTVGRIDNYEYLLPKNKEFFQKLGVDSLIYPEMLAAKEIVSSIRMSWVRQWWEFCGGALILIGAKMREKAEILEIIDHHKLGSLETMKPINFRNEPVGCTATILYRIYDEQRLEIPPKIAGLLCAAIISDTLMFRSPTCTQQDKIAASALALIADIKIEDFAREMFKAGSNLKDKAPEEIFYQDYKKFIAEGNVAFGVGQISSMDEEELQEIKVRLKPFMVSECGRHGITRVYFMLTNIMDESSDVIYYGEGSEEMGKIAFQQEPEDKCFHLKGVVSRKKQMIPAMMEAAQIMANDFN